MRKFLFCFSMVMALMASCTPQSNDINKIGVMLPLTGYASFTGELLKQGVDMAIDSLGLAPSNIAIEDNRVDAKTAINVYNSLAARGYSCFLSGGGPTSMAIAPLTKGKDQVVFATAVNASDLTVVSDRMIRLSPTGKSMASKLADYNFNQLNLKKTSIVFINIEMGDEFRKGYKDHFEEIGGTIVSEHPYDANQRDFKDIISKVIADKPEGVYIVGVGENMSILIKQILQDPRAKDIVVTGDFNFSSAGVIEALGKLPRDIYYTDINIDEQFAKVYESKYHQPASVYPAFTFSLLQIYKQVLDGGEVHSATELHDAIVGKSFKTAVNTIAFDEKGEPTFDIVFKKLRKNE